MRSPQEVIREQLVGPLRTEAWEAGNGKTCWPPRLVLLKTLDELRAMTVCAEYGEGLDFSTEEDHSARSILYDMRDDLHDVGLFFIAEPRVGIKFTIWPQIGLGWRIGEFFGRSHSLSHQIASWSAQDAARFGNPKAKDVFGGIGEKFRDHAEVLRRIKTDTDSLLALVPGGGVMSENGSDEEPHRRPPPVTEA